MDKNVDKLIEALLIVLKRLDKQPKSNDKVLLAMIEKMNKKSRNRTFGSNY